MEASFYEEYARVEASHWWFVGRRKIFDAVLRSLDLPTGSRLLDLGCGTGVNLDFLAGYGEAMGLDWDAAAARYARKRSPAPVLRGDVTALPFPNESVDLVEGFYVASGLQPPRIPAANGEGCPVYSRAHL